MTDIPIMDTNGFQVKNGTYAMVYLTKSKPIDYS